MDQVEIKRGHFKALARHMLDPTFELPDDIPEETVAEFINAASGVMIDACIAEKRKQQGGA